MVIKDGNLYGLIDDIGTHYRNNIRSRVLRKALATLPLGKDSWERIDRLTNFPDLLRIQGYRIEDLYEDILAVSNLVSRLKRDVVPNLRQLVNDATLSGSDKILQSMAASNFPVNVRILADKVNELYLKLIEADKKENPASPFYKKLPELAKIGQLLIED